MNIYVGLLFNQGHLQDPALVRSLATDGDAAGGPPAPAPQGADAGDAPAGEGRRHPAVRRGPGWVELQAALLSAFR